MANQETGMESITEIHFFGSLGREGRESPSLCRLRGPTPLGELLRSLQVPPDRVQLVMVNHRAVPPDSVIQPGDRVSLFPREYTIFADWKNLRF